MIKGESVCSIEEDLFKPSIKVL